MFRSILATYREAFSGLNRAVWLLALTTLVNRSGTMVLPFLILYLTQQQGFEPTDAPVAPNGNGGVKGRRKSKKDKLREAALRGSQR